MCGDDNDDMCTRLNLRCPWNYRDDSHIVVSFDSEIIDTSSSFCEPKQLTLNVDEHICGNVLSFCNYVNDDTSIPHISLHDTRVTECLYEHAMFNIFPIDATPSLTFDSVY